MNLKTPTLKPEYLHRQDNVRCMALSSFDDCSGTEKRDNIPGRSSESYILFRLVDAACWVRCSGEM